jgi:hypothetical protein
MLLIMKTTKKTEEAEKIDISNLKDPFTNLLYRLLKFFKKSSIFKDKSHNMFLFY